MADWRPTLTSPDFIWGAVLGGLVGRTLDALSNEWFFGLLVLLTGVWLKGWPTKWCKRRLQADLAREGVRPLFLKISWGIAEIALGAVVLMPFIVAYLLIIR